MKMYRFTIIVASFLLVGSVAHAEQAAPPSNGPLVVEEIQSGLVIAPDVRATRLKGDVGALAGGYIGHMTDRTWVFGAGGYWLTNRNDQFNMWYAGPVVEYLFHADHAIGLGVRGLVGIGSATLPYAASQFLDPRRLPATSVKGRHATSLTVDPNATIGVNDDFFVAEPQVNVMWNLGAGHRLMFGVGYRQTGNAPYLGSELNGLSGSVSVQFGGT